MTQYYPTLADLPEHLSDWDALWAEYTCRDGTGHVHAAMGSRSEDGIEGTAELVAESVASCDGKHIGKDGRAHGKPHSAEEIRRAHSVAVASLITQEAEEWWTNLRHNIAMYQKWGGHMPKAVIMVDKYDPAKTQILVTDQHGNPTIYPVHDGAFKLPDPREFGAVADDIAGWTIPKEKTDG